MRGVSVADLASGNLGSVSLEKTFDRDSLAYPDSLENDVTSARDQGRILEQLFYGQLISPTASSRMLDILKATRENGKLRRIAGPGTVVAHKTGGVGAGRARHPGQCSVSGDNANAHSREPA